MVLYRFYQLRNSLDDKVYVGSTTRKLAIRMNDHRYKARMMSCPLHRHMMALGSNNFFIQSLDAAECDTIHEAHKIEQTWIDSTREKIGSEHVLNKARAHTGLEGLSKKEYYRRYRKENRTRIYQSWRRWEMRNPGRMKEYNHKWADKIGREIVSCPCGGLVSRYCMVRHLSTKRHKSFFVEFTHELKGRLLRPLLIRQKAIH